MRTIIDLRIIRGRLLGAVLAVSFLLFSCQTLGWPPVADITFEVVDDQGRPVADASVEVGVLREGKDQEGKTDETGRWRMRAPVYGNPTVDAKLDGYYPTINQVVDVFSAIPEGVTITRRLPPVTCRVVLRPIGNPAPMYVKSLRLEVPDDGQEVGFDFLKGDWVAPRGTGETADVLVAFREYADDEGVTWREYNWRFPRPGDGMVRIPEEACFPDSQFKVPRFAPENGYLADWRESGRVGDRSTRLVTPAGPLLARTYFFFRIRTEFDMDGNVVRALYGKFQGGSPRGIALGWRHLHNPSFVLFSYRLNPDGTRNLETDMTKNLFYGRVPSDRRIDNP